MYRILNPQEEPQGQILTTGNKSPFRQEVFAYRKLSHDIYIFAKKTGLLLYNAIRVAENAPAFLDVLNDFFISKESNFDLQMLAVNDPLRYISGNDLYAFISSYIAEINETGLFYDWGKDHYLWEYIWETIRYYEFPDMPSRMDSLFLFDDKANALDFLAQHRDATYQLADITLVDGITQSFDMNWFSDVPSDIPLYEAEEYARNYWRQVHTDKPIIETLFIGKYSW